ncbi:MAG: LamG domain-containing protein, partial [Chloroflexota bacterium]
MNGTSGALTLNGQGGSNSIAVGLNSPGEEATSSLDRINAPINVLGLSNSLLVADAASTTSHVYVMDRNFVQREGKARIDFQNLSRLSLNAGQGTDQINVRDTISPPIGFLTATTIFRSGGDDRISISRTTGHMAINVGGNSVIEVGNALNSLDNIQGRISVTPSGAGNYVTLILNDQAATTGQQFDVAPGAFGALFQRSGAALIQDLFSPLGSFQWLGGSGGDTVNVRAQPAVGSSFVLGAGDDVLNAGTAANTLVAGSVDIGVLGVIGGAGTDQLLIRDQGTTTPRRYELSVGQFVGQESRGAVGARPLNSLSGAQTIIFDQVESVTLDAGSGGNLFKIAGAPAATSVLIHTGAGSDTVDVGTSNAAFGAVNSLRDIRGPLTLDGQGGLDRVTFNDQGRVADENYSLYPGVISTTFASPDYHYAGIEALTINGSAGANNFGFSYNPGPADPLITLNGGGGRNLLAGPHVPNLWRITGANSGTLNTIITFTSMQSFYGGADDDTFILSAGAGLDGSINGGGGRNTLDYSGYAAATTSIPGLVGWYKGEGNANDAVGGNHGTLVNGVAFAPGRVGQAFSFDGVDDYVQVPNSASLETPTISVEAWVNATAPGSYRYVVAKGASGVTAASYALYTGSTAGLYFYIFDGLTAVLSPNAGPGVWDGNWHHVVGTFDGSTVRLYVDGLEIGVGTPTMVQIGYALPTTNDLFVGSYQGSV